MSEQVTKGALSGGKATRTGGYLFLPKAWQKGAFALWLRRMHAWTGVYGALTFLLLGISGFYLHHRSEMKIENGRLREVAALTAFVEKDLIAEEEDLANWLVREYQIAGKRAPSRGRPSETVEFAGRKAGQPQIVSVTYRAPNATISADHVIGSNIVTLKRQDASPLKALIDMHKAVGVSAGFILLMDTIAGALIFMSVSGVLLWTRMHGPRIAAAGLFLAVLAASAIALSGAWVSWSAP
jgi:hypothetical protein